MKIVKKFFKKDLLNVIKEKKELRKYLSDRNKRLLSEIKSNISKREKLSREIKDLIKKYRNLKNEV